MMFLAVWFVITSDKNINILKKISKLILGEIWEKILSYSWEILIFETLNSSKYVFDLRPNSYLIYKLVSCIKYQASSTVTKT